MEIPGPVRSAARSARAGWAAARLSPYVAPGHFYSPVSTALDASRAVSWRERELIEVDLRERHQLELVQRIASWMTELPSDRWQPNDWFGRGDAAVLHAMLRHLRPRRVVEVGSGYSTAVMLDTAERHLTDLHITCVEPYPDRLKGLLRPGDAVELIATPVQDAGLESFEALSAGDVVFIDSTHVVKAGSDVAWLMLHVLPTLPQGIVVHVHDIFWPFEYPETWLRERRDWTEAYLLRAFLAYNSAWQVELFTSWLWERHADELPAELRTEGASSLWMRRNG
jgi:predicted O-methyltransferase YrrM